MDNIEEKWNSIQKILNCQREIVNLRKEIPRHYEKYLTVQAKMESKDLLKTTVVLDEKPIEILTKAKMEIPDKSCNMRPEAVNELLQRSNELKKYQKFHLDDSIVPLVNQTYHL